MKTLVAMALVALVGCRGPMGIEGEEGPAGEQGPEGPEGPPGEPGESGTRGATGDRGARGPGAAWFDATGAEVRVVDGDRGDGSALWEDDDGVAWRVSAGTGELWPTPGGIQIVFNEEGCQGDAQLMVLPPLLREAEVAFQYPLGTWRYVAADAEVMVGQFAYQSIRTGGNECVNTGSVQQLPAGTVVVRLQYLVTVQAPDVPVFVPFLRRESVQ
jgi:hypothetical protein